MRWPMTGLRNIILKGPEIPMLETFRISSQNQ